MKRLKENLTNILLIIVIIVCTVCICNKQDENKQILDKINNELEYKVSDSTVENLYRRLDNIDTVLHSIDLTLDGSLDDILYYMPKAR